MSKMIRLVHLADLHLGFSGPQTLVYRPDEPHAGRFVRDVDIEQATRAMVKAIINLDAAVDIVVIAGDLFHRANPLPRAIAIAARFVRELVQREIEVVVIDGNHDVSAERLHRGSSVEYLKQLGAYVINGNSYDIAGTNATPWKINPALNEHLLVHGLPYQATLQRGFTGVQPRSGRINVLVAHGRVGGAPDSPETNTMGLRTAEIPAEVLRRGWEYVALGDWHIHAHQPLSDAPAYYAGSLEALTFGEAARFPIPRDDPRARGGGLYVELRPSEAAKPVTLPNPCRRPVLTLQPIDAAGMDSDALLAAVRDRLDNHLPVEALARLDVHQCSSVSWNGLNPTELGRLRSLVRRCDIRPQWATPDSPGSVPPTVTLEDQWDAFVSDPSQGISSDHRDALLAAGRERLRDARQAIQQESGADPVDATIMVAQ